MRSRFSRWCRRHITLDLIADTLIYATILALLVLGWMIPALGIFVLGGAAGAALTAILWR